MYMNSRPLDTEDVEQLKVSVELLKHRLSDLEKLESFDISEWFNSINRVFGGFYKDLYAVIMSSHSYRSFDVPPLDSISHIEFANDAIELESAAAKIYNVLSDADVLNNERAKFPHGDIGEVCFTLARVLWHLADFQFPTKGQFPKDGKSIHLSIDGERIDIERP